ncbi:MAG: phosphotransferase [Butyrivibrio sp.]|uniref:phosphotransferase n=1 Tax=Butyrivibrio sp. TaxID=28121 RepID=UPI0025BBA1AC|nr:phosphotransferase [Butyrivibrio sp.]MBQ6587511.1 phosphotransferase [Butyrivibrio sp.]
MKSQVENGKLIILLPERIDANNSDSVNTELQGIISGADFQAIVMDGDELDYISSAGLRVLLGIKKQTDKPFDVINISQKIYEVFDLTGFSDVFNVHRKPREISLDGLKIIGKGTLGTVYKLDDEKVVKVYNAGAPVPYDRVEQEKKMARQVFVKGISTALSYEMVHADNAYGVVFELLSPVTVMDYMLEHPDEKDEMTVKVCDLLKKIHSAELTGDNVPSMKNMMLGSTAALAQIFSEDEMARFQKLLFEVPDRKTAIHGDYHPGNIMVDKNKDLVLIDVGDMSTSHPFFEFYDMYPVFLLADELGAYASKFNDAMIRDFFHIGSDKEYEERKNFMQTYWNRLLQLYFAGHSDAEIATYDSYFRGIGRLKQFIAILQLPDEDPQAKMMEIGRAKELFFNEFDKIPPVGEWWPKDL